MESLADDDGWELRVRTVGQSAGQGALGRSGLGHREDRCGSAESSLPRSWVTLASETRHGGARWSRRGWAVGPARGSMLRGTCTAAAPLRWNVISSRVACMYLLSSGCDATPVEQC